MAPSKIPATGAQAQLTGRRGCSDGPEQFAREAMLGALPGCDSFSLSGEGSFIPATQTRGAMATVMVEVSASQGFRFPSGFERTHPAKPAAAPKPAATPKPAAKPVVLDDKRTPDPKMSEAVSDNDEPTGGDEPAGAADAGQEVERFQFTMSQERRPPLMGCWLVKNIVSVRRYQLFGADVE